MRLYLICDNEDTALGMRLAGIEGTVTESRDEVRELFEKAAKDPDIGIILINQTARTRSAHFARLTHCRC